MVLVVFVVVVVVFRFLVFCCRVESMLVMFWKVVSIVLWYCLVFCM